MSQEEIVVKKTSMFKKRLRKIADSDDEPVNEQVDAKASLAAILQAKASVIDDNSDEKEVSNAVNSKRLNDTGEAEGDGDGDEAVAEENADIGRGRRTRRLKKTQLDDMDGQFEDSDAGK